jgi:hypothetical protein
MDLHGERLFEIDASELLVDVGIQHSQREPAVDPEDELGETVFRERVRGVFDRYLHGIPLGEMTFDVRRDITAALQNGDWVRLNISWVPDKSRGVRHLDALAQIVYLDESNCAWRRMRFEALRPWVEMESVSLSTAEAPFTSGNRLYGDSAAVSLSTASAPYFQSIAAHAVSVSTAAAPYAVIYEAHAVSVSTADAPYFVEAEPAGDGLGVPALGTNTLGT